MTDKELQERLNSPRNLANRFAKVPQQVSQQAPSVSIVTETQSDSSQSEIQSDIPKIPEFLKTVMAIESVSGLPKRSLLKEFGPLPSRPRSDNRVQNVRDLAVDKLMTALEYLDDDKMATCDAKGLTTVATGLGKIVETMTPKETIINGQSMNLIVYAPQVREEKSYQVVEV